MNHLESRVEKLEAKAPAQRRPYVQMIFDPEDFGGDIVAMDAAVDKAGQEVDARGEELIALILVPAVDGRPKYPEQVKSRSERVEERERNNQ